MQEGGNITAIVEENEEENYESSVHEAIIKHNEEVSHMRG